MKIKLFAFRLTTILLAACSVFSLVSCSKAERKVSVPDGEPTVVPKEEYGELSLANGEPLENGKDYVQLEKGLIHDFPVVAEAGDVQNDLGDLKPGKHIENVYLEKELPPVSRVEIFETDTITAEDVLKAWDYAVFVLSEDFYQAIKVEEHENITAQFISTGPLKMLMPINENTDECESFAQPYACLYEDYARIYGSPEGYLMSMVLVRADKRVGVYIEYDGIFIGKDDFEAVMSAFGVRKLERRDQEIIDYFRNTTLHGTPGDFQFAPYSYEMPTITRETIRNATPEQLQALYRAASNSILIYNKKEFRAD
ncbi:MAG: hypothetical protein E7580_00680 [Ruminococcaceae bacterium]|nr:hypothetical protein [Oscillospiraceae bacterium]